MTGLGISPLPLGGSPITRLNQKWPTCEQIGYITLAVSGFPRKGCKSEGDHK